MGNSWTYSGFLSYADNAAVDTDDLVLTIDSSILIDGNEYFAVTGDYEHWYRLGKSQVYVTDANGDQKVLQASHVSQETTIHQEGGTYEYFTGGAFDGSLTRVAFPDVTVINTHASFRVEDIYKDGNGSIVQRKVVYYSIDKGPTCFKYYGNRENPGSGNIYLLLQYTVESMVIQKGE